MAEPLDVVWVAPETIDRARGEYREYLGQRTVTADVEGVEISAVVDDYGDRVVWVNSTPDDPEDPDGYFRRYDGPESEYQPVVTEQESQEENGE